MRDYLYIWNDPATQFIVASGIEFRDISDSVGQDGGLILLKHDASILTKYIQHDRETHLEYVQCTDIPKLLKEDIYSWGDFCWVDYAGGDLPSIPDHELAELLFFAQTTRPLHRITIPCLGNRYLCYAHDDGWYLKLYYSSWEDVVALVGDRYPQFDLEQVRKGDSAYWVSETSVEKEEITGDIDAILNRRRAMRSKLKE